MMKERPIIFNSDQVRAILDGRKTQTRRVVPEWQLPSETEGPHDQYPNHKFMSLGQRDRKYGFGLFGATEEQCMEEHNKYGGTYCPYGSVGDQLWVRETWQGPLFDPSEWEDYQADPEKFKKPEYCHYRASGDSCEFVDMLTEDTVCRWRPSIHMPRWASRIQLEITGVRVERLQDISEQDAIAEGLRFHHIYNEWGGVEPHPAITKHVPQWRWYENPITAFQNLWDSMNGKNKTKCWNANPWVWVIEFKRVEV